MTERREDAQESDQLPEENPAEVVPDDDGDGNDAARGKAESNDGSPPDGQATGHPQNAG